MTLNRLRTLAVAAAILSPIATLPLGAPAEATFPGTDGVLAYVAAADSGYVDIWTWDGQNSVDVTNSPHASDYMPSYSADGQHIVWMRNGNVWVMNADGSNQTRLTSGGSLHLYGAPTFTPDNHIVYESDQGLSIMGIGGGHQHPIGINGRSPSVAPSGRWVTYTHETKATGADHVFKAHLDGTHATDLTPHAGSASDPDWAPNGRRILYISSDQTNWSVMLMRTDGTHKNAVGGGGTDILSSPVFSPSMTFLAYTDNDPSGHLHVLMQGLGQLVPVTQSDSYQPGWQPTA